MSHLINAFPKCVKCSQNIFSKGPLSFTFEAIKGVYYDEGNFEVNLSFDSLQDLKVDKLAIQESIFELEKKLVGYLPSFEGIDSKEKVKVYDDFCEEDNLFEYIFTCPHCKEKITTYNDNPDTFISYNTLENRINEVYDEKLHKAEKICLSLNELIDNSKGNLKGKKFKVLGMYLATNETFKHRGAPHEGEAYDEEHLVSFSEEEDPNIEHGIERSIIYISIELIK